MNYWVVIDHKKLGPHSLAEVLTMPLEPDTLVWHDGLPTWRQASALPELAVMFAPKEEQATAIEQEEIAASAETEEVAEADATTPVENNGFIPEPIVVSGTPARVFYDMPEAPQRPEMPQRPPTYLGWCIASILLCCMIPGIVALIYSLQVSSKYVAGDYEGSKKASERAELWLIISIVAGLVSIPFTIVANLM